MRTDRRELGAVVCGAIGVTLAAVAYLAESGQWADYCQQQFGWIHGSLTVALCAGLVSIAFGFRPDDDLEPRGRGAGLLAGIAAVLGAVLVYVLLASRGCGD